MGNKSRYRSGRASTQSGGPARLALDGESSPGKVVQSTDSRLAGGGGPHSTTHKHGGSDEVATATPAPNAIPKADGSGTLNAWITGAGIDPVTDPFLLTLR